MKKILILSDSHGNINNMSYALQCEKPDLVIHLGDCFKDAKQLVEQYPEQNIIQVPGNCDYSDEATEKIVDVEGIKILICHGHTYRVKMDYLPLQLSAQEKGVDVALFGHTHKVFYEQHNGILLLNPGSIGAPPYMIPASYAVLTVDKTTGKKDFQTKYLEKD